MPAFAVRGNDTAFGTQYFIFIHFCTFAAIAAGRGNLFSKKHDMSSFR